jgi:hypothetical protein
MPLTAAPIESMDARNGEKVSNCHLIYNDLACISARRSAIPAATFEAI